MIVLIGIGLVAGVVTAVSPCVLPVLPIVLAGGASGGRRRPWAIVAGLVATFTVSVLAAASLLRALGLPEDLLRNVSIGLLLVLAATLAVPRLGELLERPFLRLTRRRGGDLGGGFLLGASLGFVFVPCAGPVLATVTAVAASHRIGASTVAVTLAYAVGAAVPLLAIALGAHRTLRALAPRLRPLLGLLIALTAVLILVHVPEKLQTALGDYTSVLQRHTESTAYARRRLDRLQRRMHLHDLGRAQDFRGISSWINSRPLSLRELRGKVVLVDFWTYSCINCLRTLPHLEAWDRAYREDGLVIVGVHTPEFAFEHVLSNVRAAVKRLDIRYPVALDNDYATWNAYANEYWPAEYLIDRDGRLRHTHFGEGEYDQTEATIRSLLGEHGATAANVADETPQESMTPETYLGTGHGLVDYAGTNGPVDAPAEFTLPRALPANGFAYGGVWTVRKEYALAGFGARLQLNFEARSVYVVLAGRGRVDVLVDGRPRGTISVDGARLYTAVSLVRPRRALLELRFAPAIRAYSFTFG